jgi:pimeloyl-ACP methyl ester carboxylesterase
VHIEINGAPIFFDTVGAKLAPVDGVMVERPSLLVMHGGPGFDHAPMRLYFDRFADSHQVIYIDHRGNGRSGGAPDTWTLTQWGDDVHDFCRALGIERPAVYGLSFGGMVAMSYAARHPEHPASLILASTAATMDLAATYDMMERLGGSDARRIAERFWSEPGPEAAAEYMAVCMPLYNPSGALSEAVRKLAILRTEVMFHFIRGEQRTMNLLPGLAEVVCPTLVMAGGLDPITPVACSRAIAAALPPELAELVVFESAGHGVHRDEPERAEAVLRRFLNGERRA